VSAVSSPSSQISHSSTRSTHAREDDHVLLIVPTPGRGGEGIARDILRALGKRFDRPRTPRDPRTLLKLADLWLRAHRITTLIIRHADRLPPRTWREILQIAPANANTWLWAEHPITAARIEAPAGASG
jgi:hypothetical protein